MFTIKSLFIVFVVAVGLFIAGAISLFLFDGGQIETGAQSHTGYDAPWVYPNRSSKEDL